MTIEERRLASRLEARRRVAVLSDLWRTRMGQERREAYGLGPRIPFRGGDDLYPAIFDAEDAVVELVAGGELG